MAFAFRLCLALLGLLSFLLSSVNGLAVDVQPAFPNEPESTSIPILGTDENPWPAIQPIDPPDLPVPTKVPLPTGTSFIIDTRLIVKIYTGQPFIIRLDKFLQIFQDGAKVDTNPGVSWVSLDSTHRAIIGRVPKDYPPSRIFVFITGRYAFNGRAINLGYVLALDVLRSHFSLAIDTDKHSHHNSAHNSSHDTSHNNSSHNNSSHNNSSHNNSSHNNSSHNNSSHNNSSHNNSSDDSSHIDDAADHLEDNSDCFTKSDLVPEREV